MNTIKPMPPEALSSVKRVNTNAPAWVFDRLSPHYPNATDRFRRACLDDLHHHVDYLTATLESGYLGLFEDYAVWLKDILERRGIYGEGLALSFTYVADYYATQVPEHEAQAVRRVMDAGVAALARSGVEVPVNWPSRHAPDPLAEVETVSDTLLSGSRHKMNHFLQTCATAKVPYLDFAVRLAQPAMYDVGRRWQQREITVSQEHVATALCQYALASYFSKSEFTEPNKRTAVFACVEGNHHALGLRMVSDHFELAGWTVQYLGANTPTKDLLEQVDVWHPEVIGLSVSLPHQINTVKQVVEQLRAEFAQAVPTILVGGLTTNQLDDLWRQVGADAWAPDAKAALDCVT